MPLTRTKIEFGSSEDSKRLLLKWSAARQQLQSILTVPDVSLQYDVYVNFSSNVFQTKKLLDCTRTDLVSFFDTFAYVHIENIASIALVAELRTSIES